MVISIVIPTYNRPHLLAQCLEPLGRQLDGAENTEVLVIDDGSLPAHAAENRRLCASHNAVYFRAETNQGVAAARNTGISRSKGDWIVLLDDDFRIDEGWYATLYGILASQSETVVGVEGMVVPSGEGLWDNEVQNRTGGLYLTCHIAYRKKTLAAAGGFDSNFKSEAPFCEDHELAVRMLRRGRIIFVPALRGVHLPRRMRLLRYITSSFKRVRCFLAAEHYFFCKQGDWYHRFRHARTFWGTYLSVLLRNVINNLRRRNIADCLRHPLQFGALVAASLIEQAGAWVMLPYYFGVLIKNKPCCFHLFIDEQRTRNLWRFRDAAAVGRLRLRFSLLHSLFFPIIKKPVYDIRPMLRRLSALRTVEDCTIILRIDDVFLPETTVIDRFIEIMGRKKQPYLAGVTGDDLLNPAHAPIIERLRKSGAEIGIHGFSHQGRFGPFESELLQMNYGDIMRKIDAVMGAAVFKSSPPRAIIPPFNAISGEQISFLARRFAIVTGGSETMRFSDQFAGPVAMKEGGWYVAATHPCYDKAFSILRAGIMEQLARTGGFVCIALHMTEEEKDGFAGLSRLLDALPFPAASWQIFTKGDTGASYFT
jgi:glycosyltransferase involved in cell wall biosynthesis